MTILRCAGICLAGALLLGCQNRPSVEAPKPVAAPTTRPVSTEKLAVIRKLDPKALVGRVGAVLASERLVQVTGLPVDQFKPGDAVSLMGDEGFLCVGAVQAVVRDTVHVKYDRGPRTPIVGDVVVRFAN